MHPLGPERPASGLTAGDALKQARSQDPADSLLRPGAPPGPRPPVGIRTPIDEVLARMDEAQADSLPVLDEEGRFEGEVTLRGILDALLSRHSDLVQERRVLNLAIERQRLALESASDRFLTLNDSVGELETMLLRTSDEDAYFRLAVDLLRTLLGARIGVMALRTEEGQWTRLAHSGLNALDVARLESLPPERGPLGVVAASPRPLRLEDLERHPGTAGLAGFHPGAQSLLAVPVLRGERVLGGVYLCDRETGGPFREEDASLALGFARSVFLTHALWRATRAKERARTEE